MYNTDPRLQVPRSILCRLAPRALLPPQHAVLSIGSRSSDIDARGRSIVAVAGDCAAAFGAR